MSPKKTISIILAILAAYGASVGFGVYRITSSEVFPLARKGLTAYLVASNSREANKKFHLRWWDSWYFGGNYAHFSLCSGSGQCHAIIGYMDEGKWAINVDGSLVNTDYWIVDESGHLVNAEVPSKVDVLVTPSESSYPSPELSKKLR